MPLGRLWTPNDCGPKRPASDAPPNELYQIAVDDDDRAVHSLCYELRPAPRTRYRWRYLSALQLFNPFE